MFSESEIFLKSAEKKNAVKLSVVVFSCSGGFEVAKLLYKNATS